MTMQEYLPGHPLGHGGNQPGHADRREAHGPVFSLESMQHARERSWGAVRQIAAEIRPGMTEGASRLLASEILKKLGMDRIWHPTIVRFGEGTLKVFKQLSDPERVLEERDIFFVDIGPVWREHEGDAGDTFVVGDDPEMHACAEAARALWRDVSARWREDGLGGTALYEYASERAAEMGWLLNLDVKGHRVCDFPHAIYKAGSLGDFGKCPHTGLWILEIQLRHPTRPFGAFYEDILMEGERPEPT